MYRRYPYVAASINIPMKNRTRLFAYIAMSNTRIVTNIPINRYIVFFVASDLNNSLMSSP